MRVFYLGTHEVSWLRKTARPLCISRRRLAMRKSWPQALGPLIIDSGAYTELDLFGEWRVTPTEFVVEIRRWRDAIGNLQHVGVQDWVCAPDIVKRTGQSVARHQLRTLVSFDELRQQAPEIPWMPILQGWTQEDYLRHLDAYRARPDWNDSQVVGVGSIVSRQATGFAEGLIYRLASREGLKLHGFGFKLLGLRRVGDQLDSADSTAWSVDARYGDPLPECDHKQCASCLKYAERWLSQLGDLNKLNVAAGMQGRLV